jgi:hypothetical protein
MAMALTISTLLTAVMDRLVECQETDTSLPADEATILAGALGFVLVRTDRAEEEHAELEHRIMMQENRIERQAHMIALARASAADNLPPIPVRFPADLNAEGGE